MSLNLYVKLDVDFASDDKILAAGPLAAYLYLVSLAHAKRTMSDGRIAHSQLPVLTVGFPGQPAKWATKLVDVGLWIAVDGGWLIAAWAKRGNLTRTEIESRSETRRLASIEANHQRWHRDGKRSADCPLCIRIGSEPDPKSDPISIRFGVRSESTEVEVEVEPEVTPKVGGARASRAERATRLPETFALTGERARYATDQGSQNPQREFDQFCDYHRAKGDRMVDWDAAWRNWCRKAATFGRAGPPARVNGTGIHSSNPLERHLARKALAAQNGEPT